MQSSLAIVFIVIAWLAFSNAAIRDYTYADKPNQCEGTPYQLSATAIALVDAIGDLQNGLLGSITIRGMVRLTNLSISLPVSYAMLMLPSKQSDYDNENLIVTGSPCLTGSYELLGSGQRKAGVFFATKLPSDVLIGSVALYGTSSRKFVALNQSLLDPNAQLLQHSGLPKAAYEAANVPLRRKIEAVINSALAQATGLTAPHKYPGTLSSRDSACWAHVEDVVDVEEKEAKRIKRAIQTEQQLVWQKGLDAQIFRLRQLASRNPNGAQRYQKQIEAYQWQINRFQRQHIYGLGLTTTTVMSPLATRGVHNFVPSVNICKLVRAFNQVRERDLSSVKAVGEAGATGLVSCGLLSFKVTRIVHGFGGIVKMQFKTTVKTHPPCVTIFGINGDYEATLFCQNGDTARETYFYANLTITSTEDPASGGVRLISPPTAQAKPVNVSVANLATAEAWYIRQTIRSILGAISYLKTDAGGDE